MISLFKKKKPTRLPDKMDMWNNWFHNKKEQKIWEKNGWGYVYQPNWYYRTGDDISKGARCADCDKWVERETCNSLAAHELNHYD